MTSAWLIEMRETGPHGEHYWLTADGTWTTNAYDAKHWRERVDAEKSLQWIPEHYNAYITQHGFQ